MVVSYLGLGSNLGNRRKNIKNALGHLKKTKGVEILKCSRIYETDPVGMPFQGKFLNGAIKINTSLKPAALLKTIKRIEKALGRKKTIRFGPRVIDIDILLYGGSVINRKELKVPHPRMFERGFVLKALREVI